MDMRPLCTGMSSEWAHVHVHECNMIEVFSMYTFMYNVQCNLYLRNTCKYMYMPCFCCM